MGFGLLFVGYFFANMMPPGDSMLSLAKLIGYPLMIAAFYRLAPYHKRFLYCFFASFATIPFAIYHGMIGLFKLGVLSEYWFLTGSFHTVAEILHLAVSLVLHVMMLLAIAGLAGELKHTAIRTHAWRNFTFVAAYFLLRFVMMMPIQTLQRLFAPTLLLWLCMVILNLFLLFKCYRYICPEGDENMPEPIKLPLDTDEGAERHGEDDDGE